MQSPLYSTIPKFIHAFLPRGPMLKILILDDAKVIRALLKMTLESDGIEVDSAATIEEAIQLATQTTYDLMVVDFMLEDGRNGLELIQAIKKLGKNSTTPCIMLSAEDGKNCKTEAQGLGAKAWVKKPFTPTGILKVVYKVLGQEYLSPNEKGRSIHHHE